MASIRIPVAVLCAICAAPAVARGPAAAAPAPVLLAATGFTLTDGTLAPAAAMQESGRALARDSAGREPKGKLAQFSNATVGPSWSYQSPRTGAIIEMGALGGGVVPDRPRLAHVAFAWQF